MSNRLKMAERQAILGLAHLGWSYRRIAKELGVDRDTVSRHIKAAAEERFGVSANDLSAAGTDPSGAAPPDSAEGGASANAAIPMTGSMDVEAGAVGSNAAIPMTGFSAEGAPGNLPPGPGSAGRHSRCEPWRAIILQGLERGLTAKRIWQDLAADHGFDGPYQPVQRFVQRLNRAGTNGLPYRRMECAPGAEAQVDFGKGAPIVTPDGKGGGRSPCRRTRPHLFRIVLSCSRKAYSEATPRQTTEQFIRCIENAFIHFGGVPRTLVIDNLKAAVTKADWYDPDLNPKIQEFARHYGTVILPTRPGTPRHKGKIERGVGYAQGNALKARTFKSLSEQNQFLAEWESTIADTRIHGTTRKQVARMFAEVEKPALLPLPPGRFPCFQEAQRIVNRDGHVEVAKAYYSAPPEFLGRTVWARWDGHVVRLFDQNLRQIAIHAQREPGRFAADDRHIVPEKRGGIERGTAWWMNKAGAIGPHAGQWAENVLKNRGIHALRVVMGLVSLTHRHSASHIEQACQVAQSHGAHRLRDIRNLLKRSSGGSGTVQEQFEFAAQHPLIRSLSDYSQLVHDAFDNTPVEAKPTAAEAEPPLL